MIKYLILLFTIFTLSFASVGEEVLKNTSERDPSDKPISQLMIESFTATKSSHIATINSQGWDPNTSGKMLSVFLMVVAFIEPWSVPLGVFILFWALFKIGATNPQPGREVFFYTKYSFLFLVGVFFIMFSPILRNYIIPICNGLSNKSITGDHIIVLLIDVTVLIAFVIGTYMIGYCIYRLAGLKPNEGFGRYILMICIGIALILFGPLLIFITK